MDTRLTKAQWNIQQERNNQADNLQAKIKVGLLET